MGAADALKIPNLSPTANIICILISKLLLVALPIAQIVLGTKYLKECPQQNFIPVFLVVCGVFSMALLLLSCLPCCQQDHPTLKCLCSIWNSLVSGFTFCWFIAGSVWVYTIYPPNYNSTVVDVPYCNKTLYQFAFWTITVAYIFLAVIILGSCCFYMCLCMCSLKRPSEEQA